MAEKISNSQKRLRELMEIKNINQSDIARRSGLNKSTISNYLAGTRSPNQVNISKIADAFKISPAWLMGYNVPFRDEKNNVDYVATAGEQEILLQIKALDESDRDLILSTLKIAYQKTIDRKKVNSAS